MMRKRFLLSVLLLFALVFAPSLSFADDGFGGSAGGGFDGDYGVKYTAVTHDGGWTGFLVKAADSWSAAVYACGGDPARISAEVRSKLSDPNYGGAFYMYATNYAHIMSVYEIPEFVPLYVLAGLGISSVWHGEFGDMMLWYADTPNSLLESAMVDFRRVLAGEDLGGGGSVEVPEGQQLFELSSANIRGINGTATNPNMRVRAYEASYTDGNLTATGNSKYVSAWRNNYYVSSARLYVPSEIVQLAYSYVNSGYDVVFLLGFSDYNGSYFVTTESSLVYGHDVSLSDYDRGNNSASYGLFGSDLHRITFGKSYMYYDSGGCYSFMTGEPSEPVSHESPMGLVMFSSPVYGVENLPPSGDWPEPEAPVIPTAPEVPTPTAPTTTTDPTIVEPTVTWPDITISVQPTPDTTDYSVLLKAINDNLNSLRSDLLTEFEGVEQGLRNIYQYLQHLDSLFERHCKHIRDSIDDNVYELELYLKDLLQWLAAQLNYDNLYEYDDSAVTTLLYRILNKIPGGNGPVTYKPNPQSDEPSFFDWLSDLWHRFLIDLVSVLPDELGGLVNAFSQLTHYFPFSIPWDMFALFALFEHEPVTPVFDIPWGYGGESGDVQMIHIDLSVWDGVMVLIRPVFIVGFCFKLAMITKDLLSNFDINKGGI